MNSEEIRKKAIECAGQYNVMCALANAHCVRKYGSRCPYYSEDNTKDCAAVYGYEQGFSDGVEEGRNEVITELLETSKHDELSQKIAWDILERGIERGKEQVLNDVKKLLYKTPTDKVTEIKCDDGEIRNRPLIDIARVYEILEKAKGE